MLGVEDSSTCGDAFATWGVAQETEIGCKKCDFEGCPRCDLGPIDPILPYQNLGFRRSRVGSISKFQICRFDSSASRGFSVANLFTRNQPELNPADSALRLVQINVWSGSTYELDWAKRDFKSYETPQHRELRFESLVTQVSAIEVTKRRDDKETCG